MNDNKRSAIRISQARVSFLIRWLRYKKRNEMHSQALNLAKCRAMRPRIESFGEGPKSAAPYYVGSKGSRVASG
jgi:hypothetical protein